MSKYEDLTDRITRHWSAPAWETGIRAALRWLDENPDQTPGRIGTKENTMSKFTDLEDKIREEEGLNDPVTHWVLDWLDDHPDRVPGRTITESELGQIVDHEFSRHASFPAKIRSALSTAGVVVIPDPEPTNMEKLGADLREIWDGHQTMYDVVRWLNDNGWVKDDE